MSQLTLIVAATTNNGIGHCGTLPWHIPKDLAYFSRVTSSAPTAQMNVVFMGRKTWESIPQKFKPLKKRINVVLSRNDGYVLFPSTTPPNNPTHLYPDLKSSVEAFRRQTNVHRLFVIGGSSLYQEALSLNSQHQNTSSLRVDHVLMTRVYNQEVECDAFFPDILEDEWRRATHEEHSAWVGFEVPAGIQTENGFKFEFQMWIRSPEQLGTTGGNL